MRVSNNVLYYFFLCKYFLSLLQIKSPWDFSSQDWKPHVANLSHLTTGFFSWRLLTPQTSMLQVGNLFYVQLIILSSLLHPWFTPSILFIHSLCHSTLLNLTNTWFTRLSCYISVIGPYFCMLYFLLYFVIAILLYLELLKFRSFLLAWLIKCSVTWKFCSEFSF